MSKHYIKFRLQVLDPEDGQTLASERIWGEVIDSDDKNYTVTLANTPLHPDFKLGDIVVVPKDFVLEEQLGDEQ